MGFQIWSDLLFVHWRVPVDTLQSLLPRRLTVDTFEGDAWVGLVLFTMSGVRPRWFPAVPRLSAFHETNVRTYVHLDGRDPGVWFFSLDAANSLAVRVARWRWHLNYFFSTMHLERRGDRVRYESQRRWPAPAEARVEIEARLGDPAAGFHATPGTLEHFLVERYFLYTLLPGPDRIPTSIRELSREQRTSLKRDTARTPPRSRRR